MGSAKESRIEFGELDEYGVGTFTLKFKDLTVGHSGNKIPATVTGNGGKPTYVAGMEELTFSGTANWSADENAYESVPVLKPNKLVGPVKVFIAEETEPSYDCDNVFIDKADIKVSAESDLVTWDFAVTASGMFYTKDSARPEA